MQMLLNVIFIMIREYSLSGNQQDLKPLVVENTAGECSCSRTAQLVLVLVLIVRSVIVLNYGHILLKNGTQEEVFASEHRQ